MPQEFLTENENEVIRNLVDDQLFVQDSFEAIPFGVNITLLVGQLRDPDSIQAMVNPGKKTVQSVRFKKPDWTLETALDWLRENQKNFKAAAKKFNVELEKISIPETGNVIQGVEIFSAGTWNGDTYTNDDLDAMVQAFENTKDTVRPFLKLGHNEEQEVLKSDGLPAAGWVTRLYRVGHKLVADFEDIPQKVFDLIVKKAYRNVSSEIFFGVEILNKKFDLMLGAVSLLGAETPAVMNLSDILARYDFTAKGAKIFASDKNGVTIKNIPLQFGKKEGMMPEANKELVEAQAELKKLREDLDKSQEQVKKFSKADEAAQKVIKGLESEKDELKKEYDLKVTELEKVRIEKEADKLESEELITKSARKFALALLGPEKKEYAFGEGKEETKLSKFELVKEFAKSFSVKEDVNFDENSSDGKKETGTLQDVIFKKVSDYAAEHEVSFAAAYKAVAPEYEKQLADVPTVVNEED